MKKISMFSFLIVALGSQCLFAKEPQLFPVRSTADHLSYSVSWNAQEKSVTITTQNQSVSAKPGSLSYTKNTFLNCELESPLILIDNQLFAPLGFWEDGLNLSLTTENGKPCLTDKPSPNDMLDDIIMPLREGENSYYVNQKVGLSLEENPSTGYIWTIDIPLGIQVISDTYTASSTDLAGAPGTHSWIMRATTPGTYTLTFKKLRPFEPDQIVETKTYILEAKTFEIPK